MVHKSWRFDNFFSAGIAIFIATIWVIKVILGSWMIALEAIIFLVVVATLLATIRKKR